MALRALLVVSVVFLFTGTVGASEPPVVEPETELERDAVPLVCMPADKCCRICDRGKACGNSCISRSKTCYKGRGCACNADELCSL